MTEKTLNNSYTLSSQDFFPYDSYRPEQRETIKKLAESVKKRGISLLIAPNGTGKTPINLSSVLPESFKIFINKLNILGEIIKDHLDSGKNMVGRVAKFLLKLIESKKPQTIDFFFGASKSKSSKLSENNKIQLEIKSLDPRPVTDIIFQKSYAIICSSGTVNEEFFGDVLNLKEFKRPFETISMSYPFPQDNKIVFIDKKLTTRSFKIFTVR